MLTREQVLSAAAAPRPTEEVEVDGLGVVRVRVLSAAELADAVKRSQDQEKAGKPGLSLASFVAVCLCDEHGAPLFGPTDAEALANLPHHALKTIEATALKLNKLTDNDHEAARKNS